MLFCCHSNRSEAKDGARAWGWKSGVAGDKPESQEAELLELGETLGGWGRGQKEGESSPRPKCRFGGRGSVSLCIFVGWYLEGIGEMWGPCGPCTT